MKPAILLLAVLPLLAGCFGGSGPTLYSVSGTVSYTGKPLTAGHVAFTEEEASDGTQERLVHVGEIVNGKFQARVSAGKKRVEIYGSYETGRMVPDEMGEKEVPERGGIPAQYNSETTLEVTIPQGGMKDLAFDLE